MFRDDNYSGLQPHFVKDGVIAKATVLNPAYDLEKHKIRSLNIGKDVILSVRLFVSTNESVNEAKFKSPDYIISTTPASSLPQQKLGHADVMIGLKLAEKLKNYTLHVRHYKLVHADGKVALKLTPEGKTAVRVRTEDDPKYLQLIQKTVNDVVADYVSKLKESVNEALDPKAEKFLDAIQVNDRSIKDLKNITVDATPQGNWSVYYKGKRMFTLNGKMLDDKTIMKYGLEHMDESLSEGKKIQRPVNRWLELKNDESMHANKKLATGLRELKYQFKESVNEAAPLYKDWDEFVNPHYILVTLKNGKKLKIEKKNVKGGTNVYHAILKAFNDNNHKITNKVVSGMLDRLGESVNETTLNEDDMQEPGGDVVSTNGVQDHEVSMAKASLMSIGKAVQDLMGRLGDQEKDIPGWIQDHITNAENYIVQASKGYYDQQDKKLGNNIPRPENQPTTQSNGK
jgi:hypothetical protein